MYARRIRNRQPANGGCGRHLAFRLTVRGTMPLIFVIAFGLLLTTLSYYADTYIYCQDKASDLTETREDYEECRKELEEWLSDAILTKCRTAECVLNYTPGDIIDRQYLSDLSDMLEVESIHVYDGDGRLTVTNAAGARGPGIT